MRVAFHRRLVRERMADVMQRLGRRNTGGAGGGGRGRGGGRSGGLAGRARQSGTAAVWATGSGSGVGQGGGFFDPAARARLQAHINAIEERVRRREEEAGYDETLEESEDEGSVEEGEVSEDEDGEDEGEE